MFKRLHNFLVTHDEIKIFMIIYVAGAIAVALFINLFAFLVWILAHYALDVYTHRFEGFSWRYSIVHSLQDCRLDFMFFAVGLSIDLILHYSVAATAARSAPVLGRGMQLFGNFLKVIPRLAGAVKAAEGVAHITFDVLHHKTHDKEYHEEEKIKILTWDYVAVIVGCMFLFTAVYIALIGGSSMSDILHESLKVLNPTHIQGFSMFR